MHNPCNLCGKNDYKILEEDKGPFKIVRCNYCSSVYVTPLPPKEFIEEYYSLNYYIELEQQLPKTLKVWQERLKLVESFQKKGILLDVGCGIGSFLSLARNNGWEVYGTEISKEICNYIKERLGLEVYNGRLQDADYPDEYFDVVTFWHVLEHMQDPLEALKVANRILKKDGLFVVATPNVNNYIYKILYLSAKIKNKPFFLSGFGERNKELHFYYFSPVTIKEILQKAGFNVFLLRSDISGISMPKRMIDGIANYISYPFRLNISLSMGIYARKFIK